jgi:hypothetical protein
MATITLPPLHCHQLTLSVQGGTTSLPPKGVFDWHYLQCAIKRFGTPAYKNFLNIRFFIHPFKTGSDDSDSDDKYSDNDGPPYPSYQFDQFLAEQGKRQMMRELHEKVGQWSSEVPSGI